MGFGTIYQVENSAATSLASCSSKSDWYDALAEIGIDSAESLDAEDSLEAWAHSFAPLEGPLSSLFVGDLRTPADDSDDPSIVFLGSDLTKRVASALESRGPAIANALSDYPNELWLLDPLRAFVSEAAQQNRALILMWGG